MSEFILEMKHIHKSYGGIKALKDVSLELKAGEVLCLCGENGAGKSTLIKSMLGILSPDSGEAKMFGRDSFQFRKKNAEYIGANFGQKSSLVWDLPFIYSLELNKKIYRVSDERYEEIIEELE